MTPITSSIRRSRSASFVDGVDGGGRFEPLVEVAVVPGRPAVPALGEARRDREVVRELARLRAPHDLATWSGTMTPRHVSNRSAQKPPVHRTSPRPTLRTTTCGLADVSDSPRPRQPASPGSWASSPPPARPAVARRAGTQEVPAAIAADRRRNSRRSRICSAIGLLDEWTTGTRKLHHWHRRLAITPRGRRIGAGSSTTWPPRMGASEATARPVRVSIQFAVKDARTADRSRRIASPGHA